MVTAEKSSSWKSNTLMKTNFILLRSLCVITVTPLKDLTNHSLRDVIRKEELETDFLEEDCK